MLYSTRFTQELPGGQPAQVDKLLSIQTVTYTLCQTHNMYDPLSEAHSRKLFHPSSTATYPQSKSAHS